MRVVKCDRCGATYEHPFIAKYAVKVHTDSSSIYWNSVDLCKDCYAKLMNFLGPNICKELSSDNTAVVDQMCGDCAHAEDDFYDKYCQKCSTYKTNFEPRKD